MQTSESIKELTAALAKAQGEFDAVSKTGHNPFLKNNYATLDDIIGAIRGPLSKHGIAFMQPLTGNSEGFVLETVLMHESGEWLSCAANVPSNAGSKGTNELQSFGGALTYMRRYMLSALLGINAEEDTDGNGSKPKQSAQKPAAKVEPKASPKARMHQAMADAIAPPTPIEAADPKNWDALTVPENYTDLYSRVHELGIDDASPEGRRKHAANIIKKTYPDNGASAGDAWKAIIEYQRSKLEVPA